MAKHFIVKFILAFIVLCMKHETMGDVTFSAELKQHINHIVSTQHWKGMTFIKLNSEFGWMSKVYATSRSNSSTPITKLKNFPYLMGCGYGQELYDFLWLTIHTGDVCKELYTKTDIDDCWSKLKACIENGVNIMSKLVSTLNLIHSFHESMIPSPYYKIFLSIRNFLKIYDPRKEDRDSELGETRQTMILVNALGNIYNENCAPEHEIFVIDNLMKEYTKSNTASSLYDFYVRKLNYYTTYISRHLLELRFYYNMHTDTMSYVTPFQSG